MSRHGNRAALLVVLLSLFIIATATVASASGGYGLRSRAFPGYEPPGELVASSAMVVDLITGDVLFEQNADARMGPASLVKVATLSMVFEALEEGRIALDDEIEVSERAWSANVPGSKMFIEVGERIPLHDLMQGIAVASGNDACIAVAEHLGGTEEGFVASMNRLARDLDMEDTLFANSHGLPAEGQYTTARDVAKLARYFSLRFPEGENYTSQEEFVYGVATPHRHWNGLLFRDDRVVGLKTGYTGDSGFHLAATARDGDRYYLAVVMGIGAENSMEYPEGTATREDEALRLLNWAFENFELYDVPAPDELDDTVRIYGGSILDLGLHMDPNRGALTLPTGTGESLVYRVDIEEPLRAPLSTDDPVGSVEVFWPTGDGEEELHLATWSVFPGEDVAPGGLWRRFIDWLILLFSAG